MHMYVHMGNRYLITCAYIFIIIIYLQAATAHARNARNVSLSATRQSTVIIKHAYRV